MSDPAPSLPSLAPFTEVRGKEAILNYIFNPRAFIGAEERPKPAGRPSAESPAECAPAPDPAAAAEARLKAEEKAAVTLADAGDLAGALAALNALIVAHPTRASCFNNRAQVHRLLGANGDALADLNTCVELGEAQLESVGPADAPALRSVLHNAYLQRSIVYQATPGQEALAEADVKKSAAYGNKFARMMTAEVCEDSVTSFDFFYFLCGWLRQPQLCGVLCRLTRTLRCATRL